MIKSKTHENRRFVLRTTRTIKGSMPVAVICGALVLGVGSSCGTSHSEGVPDAAVQQITDEDGQESDGLPDNGTLMAFDESIPLGNLELAWYMKDDLNELSQTSALAFIGRVINYKERIKLLPMSDEVPSAHRGHYVYDGVVFKVDELLLGSLQPDVDTVTVAVRTLRLKADGTPVHRLSSEPLETVREGIAKRGESDGPSYIVYVTEEQDPQSSFFDWGYYSFNTPGGVAPMMDGGQIGVAQGRPLANPIVLEDGVYREIAHGLTLADARAVGRAVDEHRAATGGGPASPFDNDDTVMPDPVGPVGAVDG